MLYNLNKKHIKVNADCLTCEYFNRKLKKCEGVGKCCFEYDEKTKTAIDPVSHLPLKIK